MTIVIQGIQRVRLDSMEKGRIDRLLWDFGRFLARPPLPLFVEQHLADAQQRLGP
jgi:hypothetical protein